MAAEFRTPYNQDFILFDNDVDDEAFKEVKELLIETINNPIFRLNLNFVTEMGDVYGVFVEELIKYKKLYEYMVTNATRVYYQLCENNFTWPDSPDYELHPSAAWFFCSFPGDYVPHHLHNNAVDERLMYSGAPNYGCNGTMYLNTFDVEKEMKHLENSKDEMASREKYYNPNQSSTHELHRMELQMRETSRGQIFIETPDNGASTNSGSVHIYPKAKTNIVLTQTTRHFTYAFKSDQVRISFVYNCACIVAPTIPWNQYSSVRKNIPRLSYNSQFETPTYMLDPIKHEKIMKSIQ